MLAGSRTREVIEFAASSELYGFAQRPDTSKTLLPIEREGYGIRHYLYAFRMRRRQRADQKHPSSGSNRACG